MKLSSLVLVLISAISGSLLVADGASAQDPVYSSPGPAPVYASGPAAAPARSREGGIKDLSVHERPYTVSGLLYIPWFRGIGIGLKAGFEIPVAPNGFIPAINDSVSIEPSFAIAYTNYYNFDNTSTTNYVPAVSGLWSFHFKPDLRVYGALTLGANIYQFHWDDDRFGRNYYDSTDVDPFIEVAGGIFYKMADKIALRAELGWYGPRGGISFLL